MIYFIIVIYWINVLFILFNNFKYLGILLEIVYFKN